MNKIKEREIQFETAKLAKEKGLEPGTMETRFFKPSGKVAKLKEIVYEDYKEYFYFSPTQFFLQTWLREVHEILVFAMPSNKKGLYYWYVGYLWDEGSEEDSSENPEHSVFEDALEEGLIQALKLL